MAKSTATLTAETNDILKQLESKMSGIMGVVDTLSRKIDETNDMFAAPDSAYYLNMSGALSTSMHESEMDRRLYEEAMEQNRRAEELSRGRSPERGDANFWSQAFMPTPMSPAETQANALKATFTDSSVMDAFKNMLGGGGSAATKTDDEDSKAIKDIVKEALRGDADDRTRGEKFLDWTGFGNINKIKNWWADRDIRKEEKETAKDQGMIKRTQKDMNRLAAKYRKMKASGASEEELTKVRDDLIGRQLTQDAAAQRIRERRNTDLFEMDGMPGKETAQPLQVPDLKAFVDMFSKAGVNTAAVKTGEVVTPTTAVSTALAPITSKSKNPEIIDAEIVDDVRTKDVTGDKNEPVELAKGTKGALAPVGDAKEAADIQRKLDTQLRPEFYKEGLAFFKKANSGALFDGLAGMMGGGGMGGMGKAGLYAAAAVAVGASLAKIGQAAGLVKDWYNASNEAVENVKKMTEQNNANLEKRKNGVNDDMLTATQESNSAAQELHESEESWADSAGSFVKDTLFGGLFGKSDRKKAQEKAAAAEKKRKEELEKYRKLKESAKKNGVNTEDLEEMKKFKLLYDMGQADTYQSIKAQQNGKLAAGNMQESGQQQTAQTPGAKAEPDKAVTAEEQMKRQEEATYNATKRALLDNDVQRQNEENAKIQGQQIDQSLNGRK
jgi:hypothetical protein